MNTVIIICQIIIALGIYNVWLLRVNKATPWRGGNARTMEEEFHTYGLSSRTMKITRACKLLSATAVLLGVWWTPLAILGASALAVLMVIAVLMHFKVRDPISKSIPAATVLALCLLVAFSH